VSRISNGLGADHECDGRTDRARRAETKFKNEGKRVAKGAKTETLKDVEVVGLHEL